MKEKLIKGRYLTFSYPVPKLTYALGDFLTQPKNSLTIEQSSKEKLNVPMWDSKAQDFARDDEDKKKLIQQRQRVSGVVAGENAEKEHRNFQWLRYYGGAINQVAFDNLDVLSGDFSGCWMMEYRKDGVLYVGHVGTIDDPNKPHSVAAKKAWNDFALAHAGDILRGFSPARAWSEADSKPSKIHGDGLPRIWGLVTKSELISVYLFRGEADWNRYRIADWKVVDPAYMPALATI